MKVPTFKTNIRDFHFGITNPLRNGRFPDETSPNLFDVYNQQNKRHSTQRHLASKINKTTCHNANVTLDWLLCLKAASDNEFILRNNILKLLTFANDPVKFQGITGTKI